MEKAKKLRVLVAKPGLDGHDFGVRMVALAFHHAGFRVIYTGCRRTPEQIVGAAVEEDVDLIGLSILSNMYRYSLPRVLELLRESKAEDIPVICGGIIPPEDIPKLKDMGIKEIFDPDAKLKDVVDWVKNNVSPCRDEIVPANGNGRLHAQAVCHHLEWDDESIREVVSRFGGNNHSLLNIVWSPE